MVMKFFELLFMTLLFLFLFGAGPAGAGDHGLSPPGGVPILLYHRFGPVVADSMTVTTAHFEGHLQYLKRHGYGVIPLRRLVDSYLGKGTTLPPHSVVITADDGHGSVYREMYPLLKKYQVPATLFLYPSAISNASYAMTWTQIREIKESRLVDFQSHTFWHPNFKKEKKRLTPAQYESLVDRQLKKSKERLEKELGTKVDMLAWPFGIHDEELIRKASQAGYVAAFTLERHDATASDRLLALPRYLLADRPGSKVGVILPLAKGSPG